MRPVPKNPDLHGNVPETCETALIIIDVFNDFTFPGGEVLLRRTQEILSMGSNPSAADAALRDYDILLLNDCIVSIEPRFQRQALNSLRRCFDIKLLHSSKIGNLSRSHRYSRAA